VCRLGESDCFDSPDGYTDLIKELGMTIRCTATALVIAEHQKGILQLEGFTISALNRQTGRFDIYDQPERWEYVSIQQFHSVDEQFQITTPVLTLNTEDAEQLLKEMIEASWVQRALALVGTAAQRGD